VPERRGGKPSVPDKMLSEKMPGGLVE